MWRDSRLFHPLHLPLCKASNIFWSFIIKTHHSVCNSLSNQPKAYLLGYKSPIHQYWVSDQASKLQKPPNLHYQLIWWKILLTNTLTCLIGIILAWFGNRPTPPHTKHRLPLQYLLGTGNPGRNHISTSQCTNFQPDQTWIEWAPWILQNVPRNGIFVVCLLESSVLQNCCKANNISKYQTNTKCLAWDI